jgi:hypothetical protein
VRRGEVHWGETPKHGRRPYLILTRDSAIGVLSEILVATITKTVRPERVRERTRKLVWPQRTALSPSAA